MEELKSNIDDEITFKELILKLREIIKVILGRWKFILFVTLLFMAMGWYKIYRLPVTFSSKLTFMLNEDDGGNIGGLGSLVASFGGGISGDFNLEKILALLRSRTIVQQVLFEKISLEDKDDFIINHIIKCYGYHDKWEENKSLNKFLFRSSNFDSFTRKEKGVLKTIHRKVIATDGLLYANIDNSTSILTMGIESLSETLSLDMTKLLFEKLSNFYINKTIEKQKQNFEIAKFRSDSIRLILDGLQYKVLKMQDTDRNLSLMQYKSEEFKMQRELRVLIEVYTENRKNQEITEFALKNKTPVIQVIDFPIVPLSPSKGFGTYLNNIILYAFLGAFLAIIFFAGKNILGDILIEK